MCSAALHGYANKNTQENRLWSHLLEPSILRHPGEDPTAGAFTQNVQSERISGNIGKHTHVIVGTNIYQHLKEPKYDEIQPLYRSHKWGIQALHTILA